MNIESADIIRLIEQFLKEHNLHKTLDTLQSESGVTLNTVDSVDSFKDDIVNGRWDVVLRNSEHANIPHSKLVDLYEQIIIELAELQDVGPARALLRQTEPMDIVRNKQPERYLKLEQLLTRAAHHGTDTVHTDKHAKESRRLEIAQKLAGEVTTAPPSRLLTLLGQAIKGQQSRSGSAARNDAAFDLFHGETLVQSLDSAEDKIPEKLLTTVKFPKKQHPTALAFSAKGNYMISGSGDGFIEVWNFVAGKLAADLPYQAEGSLMMMDGAITSLAFSHSGDLICSGAKDGKMKVWKLKSGSTYKRFPAAHSGDVTCVCFSDDDSQVLSGGIDGILRIHGLKSGSMLKEFHGHSAAATAAMFAGDMRFVVSTCEDGHVRIWDAITAACLHDIIPGTDAGGLIIPSAHSVMAVLGRPESFIVGTRSLAMHMFSTSGRLEKTFAVSGKVECNEFLAAAVMSKGKCVLAVSDKSILYGFDIETGSALEASHKVCDTEIIGVVAHPSLNVAAFFSDDRHIPVWISR
ncbi:Serine/threonine-protein kinase smu1 [Coemansia interrupta]|uniref:Serine/threonine-protein kinase smu1 n=1 Tax=Coemansia interrupta TaxID=1126814 RepID=A0A9W8LKR7_9FUNG|nr:Serine/threonine-protein kinase smu1 [Coemansia interrupta]